MQLHQKTNEILGVWHWSAVTSRMHHLASVLNCLSRYEFQRAEVAGI
jgi:hypothetical protein